MPAPSFLTPVTDSSIFLFLVLHTRGGAWGMELPQAFLFVPNPEPDSRQLLLPDLVTCPGEPEPESFCLCCVACCPIMFE